VAVVGGVRVVLRPKLVVQRGRAALAKSLGQALVEQRVGIFVAAALAKDAADQRRDVRQVGPRPRLRHLLQSDVLGRAARRDHESAGTHRVLRGVDAIEERVRAAKQSPTLGPVLIG